VINIKLKMTKE